MEETRTKPDPLLNDEEFTALMSAEYAQRGKPVDEVARQRVWQRIEASRHVAPRRFRPAWMGGPAGLAALLIIPFLALQDPQEEMWRTKGTSPGSWDISLTAYSLGTGANLVPVVLPLSPGTTLVFQADLSSPGAIALALARNDAPPAVRFVTEMPAGPQQPLARESNAYGYTVEPTDQTLRFCAFGAANVEALEHESQHLAALWPTFPASQCVELIVQ